MWRKLLYVACRCDRYSKTIVVLKNNYGKILKTDLREMDRRAHADSGEETQQ